MAVEEINANSTTTYQLLSKIATNDQHGENSPYFDGWKAYDNDPFHLTQNPNGVIQMGLAENPVRFGINIYYFLGFFVFFFFKKIR